MNAPAPLWVVEVADQRDAHLAGDSASWQYSSPPQPLEQALSLVAILLGGPAELPRAEDAPWRQAIAGGRRDIHLHRAQPTGQLLIN